MTHNKVTALVVTYNRKELLAECLSAVLCQTVPVDTLLVIDNASTDGTMHMLEEQGILGRPDVTYKRLDTNRGGAGGFYTGLKMARGMQADWVWLMDDDTIPRPDCLEKLMAKTNEASHISFLASCVCGVNHEPMNVPNISTVPTGNGYADWYMHLEQSMVKISSATFVSLLLNADAVQTCGLPCRDYFIWGDDTEYTQRLTRYYADAFLVGDSWVCHRRENAQSIDIKRETDKSRIRNYFYFYRNTLINTCLYQGRGNYIRRIARYIKEACGVLSRSHGWLKCRVIWKGIFRSAGEMRRFRNYIAGQLTRR